MSVLSFLVNLVSLYLFHGIKKHDHDDKKQAIKSNDCHHSHSAKTGSGFDCDHTHGSNEKAEELGSGKQISEMTRDELNWLIKTESMNSSHKSLQIQSNKSTFLARKSEKKELSVTVNDPSEQAKDNNKLIMETPKPKKSGKKLRKKLLAESDISERMLRTVKSGLEKTSNGLLSVIHLSEQIIINSKKVLSSKKKSSYEVIKIEDDSKKTLVNKFEENELDGINSQVSINCVKQSNCKISVDCHKERVLVESHKKESCCAHEHVQNVEQSECEFLEDSDEEEEECGSHGMSCHSHDLNFTGMLIHLLGDVISSLCVVISSIVVVKYNWVYLDTICSIVICIAIIISTIPLNYMIFKKMTNAFVVTTKEKKYILETHDKVIQRLNNPR